MHFYPLKGCEQFRLLPQIEDDIETVFHNLVDITEPICKSIDSEKADMLLFDTSGIEAWVTENNPKFANRIIKRLKVYAKTLESNHDFDPYKAAYKNMPSIHNIRVIRTPFRCDI